MGHGDIMDSITGKEIEHGKKETVLDELSKPEKVLRICKSALYVTILACAACIFAAFTYRIIEILLR